MQESGAAVLFGIVLILLFLIPGSAHMPAMPAFASGAIGEEFSAATVLFTGDIMLGRAVERLIEREGTDYPFREIENLIASADVAIGNFEAAVPERHTPTPNFGFSLSAKPSAVTLLSDSGFDLLSLANNHALDFGRAGYRNTLRVCEQRDVSCFGDPAALNDRSISLIAVGSETLAVIAFQSVSRAPTVEDIAQVMERAREISDIQVAYVHWGEEYSPNHNRAQEQLAHALIDEGADAVIGHHPHVVQDIAVYKGKAIFYSLGNFVFDQYLSKETEQGLLLQMETGQRTLAFTLVPVSSLARPSQPALMNMDVRDAYVEALVSRSDGVQEHMEGNSVVTRW